jgi:hypothetical protein
LLAHSWNTFIRQVLDATASNQSGRQEGSVNNPQWTATKERRKEGYFSCRGKEERGNEEGMRGNNFSEKGVIATNVIRSSLIIILNREVVHQQFYCLFLIWKINKNAFTYKNLEKKKKVIYQEKQREKNKKIPNDENFAMQ